MIDEFEVLWGVNNIYTVLNNLGIEYEALIKGKVLATIKKEYSPLVPGDFVRGEIYDGNKVYIEERLSRNNVFWRYNKKARMRQVISANLDNILIVSSATLPEIKNSFIDRALIIAEEEEINPVIVINKIDEGISERAKILEDIYRSLGYNVFLTSAETGEGVSELKSYIKNSRTSFLGQSGVGKSSLMNLINKDASQKINEISNRYKRGRHTTVYAISYHSSDGVIIDTPGIKEFGIETLDSNLIKYYFREFKNINNLCKFNSCLHESEPGCAVVSEIGKTVNEVRHKSYLKILGDLKKYK